MKEKIMDINRERAMFLWGKQFGKTIKAVDFAGRKIVKSAYDDRNSDFGWNIDHILPQSKYGKSVDSNLVCCHILTNDEKANKFPCFTANGIKFEIKKVQNHYEIHKIGNSDDEVDEDNDSINFFDSAAGIRCYKDFKGVQTKKLFVGNVVIRLWGIDNNAIIDFVNEIFADKNISYNIDDEIFIIEIFDYNMPLKEDATELLERCVLLNTYMQNYFIRNEVVEDYQIFYGIHNYDDKLDNLLSRNDFVGDYYLVINDLVKFNTDANKELNNANPIGKDDLDYPVYNYDFTYTQLAKNLKK